jgi:hypothetical protein
MVCGFKLCFSFRSVTKWLIRKKKLYWVVEMCNRTCRWEYSGIWVARGKGNPTAFSIYAICIRHIFVIPSSRKGISWVRNPFAISARPNDMPEAADVRISCDSEARNWFPCRSHAECPECDVLSYDALISVWKWVSAASTKRTRDRNGRKPITQ